MEWLNYTKHLYAIAACVIFLLSILGILLWKVMRCRRMRSVRRKSGLRPYVKEDSVWKPRDLTVFLDHCTSTHKISLLEALGVQDNYPPRGLTHQVRKELFRVSSHILMYKLKGVDSLDYNKVVVWVAKKCDVAKDEIATASTYELERQIMAACFRDVWDGLSYDQRVEVLRKIDTRKELNVFEVAGMSGTIALGVLNTSVYFLGFTFYTTMSTVICCAVGIFGVTLPFSAYMGASITTAFLTGPVGVMLLMIGTGGSLAFLGKANWKQTMAFIVALHCLKVDALR